MLDIDIAEPKGKVVRIEAMLEPIISAVVYPRKIIIIEGGPNLIL